MKALLILEDGWYMECRSFTGEGEAFGELVFNTGLTGYQEVITDPSYQGQIVMMTASMIGNYGIRIGEDESGRIHTEGFVVKEYGGRPALHAATPGTDGFRSRREYALPDRGEELGVRNPVVESLAGYLSGQNVPGVEGVDTRALTKRIRDRGAMKAGISTAELSPELFLERVRSSPDMIGRDLVKEVSTPEEYLYNEADGRRVAVLDCGVKTSTLRALARLGCRVEVFPASAHKSDILRTKPHGVLLSNGPGDPAALGPIVGLVAELIGELPVFGICLGHQLVGQALGAKTYKLKFGHHGGNHPVRDERTGKVYITTQNHGFAVDTRTLSTDEIEITHMNLNDHTLEGLRHKTRPFFSVQFHPEAGPGPHDTLYLFEEFVRLMNHGSGKS
jgi:carbamoyl-phosphate synthase small subunit